jgi:hypothetical protein
MILDSASPLTLGLSAVAVFSYVWPALRVANHGAWTARLWVTLAWMTHGSLIVAIAAKRASRSQPCNHALIVNLRRKVWSPPRSSDGPR